MCGIVGYVGKKKAAPLLLEGLSRLEYRGYDSSGIAILNEKISCVKAKGRLNNLVNMTAAGENIPGSIGIGHTRWATHGEPNDINSHPHLSNNGDFAVVHNGIIENYIELKEYLTEREFKFLSETDTEAISLLVEHYYNGDMPETLRKVTNKLKGSYALGVLSVHSPNTFYAVRKDSPLVIGLGKGENFIASDMPAVLNQTKTFILMEEGEIAQISADKVIIYNRNKEVVEKEPFVATWDVAAAEKDGYPHFMLKEIFYQPKAIEDTVSPNIKNGDIDFNFKANKDFFNKITKINIVACGSAYHAGMIGKYFIEEFVRIPVEVDLASEFRYRNPIINENTLTVIVSQSGETADTLAALREAKQRKSRIVSIVNVVGSSIARESDEVIYTHAGPEISVATTKGYSTQLTAIFMLGIFLAKIKKAQSDECIRELIFNVKSLPSLVKQVLTDNLTQIQQLAASYYAVSDAFFIGRGMDYAVSLEGALKLKEISYIHAEAYAAGELKHGTISLIEKGSLVISTAMSDTLFEKTLSNIKEVKTRGAVVIAVCTEKNEAIKKEADHVIFVPTTHPLISPAVSVIVLQLFGYYVAAARGLDIDKPRNLAKSVTVE